MTPGWLVCEVALWRVTVAGFTPATVAMPVPLRHRGVPGHGPGRPLSNVRDVVAGVLGDPPGGGGASGAGHVAVTGFSLIRGALGLVGRSPRVAGRTSTRRYR